MTRSSISSHSRATWLLETPAPPIARTRSSTERVDTPCTSASWISAVSAFSAIRPGSRAREVRALAQLGDADLTVPARVCHSGSR